MDQWICECVYHAKDIVSHPSYSLGCCAKAAAYKTEGGMSTASGDAYLSLSPHPADDSSGISSAACWPAGSTTC